LAREGSAIKKRLRHAAIAFSYRRYVAAYIAPCLPTKAHEPPSGPRWLHEIKHDGFRVIARKNGVKVRLYSRPGNDLTYRFPLIAEFYRSAR
jgi:ATP-dependent DNA ligase